MSVTARACSWISFNMKCLKPAFSAETALQVISLCGRVTGLPSRVNTSTFSRLRRATSPSSRKSILRVCARIAGTSEATKLSPSPRPMTSGEAFLATTISPGLDSARTQIA